MFDNSAESTDADLKSRAKKMWILGFFLLPGVWFIMPCYFLKFWKRSSREMEHVRWYVIAGCIGGVIYSALILTWMTIYLVKWQDWGALGDTLNVITYQG
ncbi:presenilin enhancer 2 [Pelomyxa schiedti]|nr:presenilin enhancer 2 [Pelomyxa schiedti]